jgi:hypothetical protein
MSETEDRLEKAMEAHKNCSGDCHSAVISAEVRRLRECAKRAEAEAAELRKVPGTPAWLNAKLKVLHEIEKAAIEWKLRMTRTRHSFNKEEERLLAALAEQTAPSCSQEKE